MDNRVYVAVVHLESDTGAKLSPLVTITAPATLEIETVKEHLIMLALKSHKEYRYIGFNWSHL